MQAPTSPWLVAAPGAPGRQRLYCFPYAGGSAAAYRSWQSELYPAFDVVAVELPGRGRRFHEAPLTSMDAVAAAVARAIAAQDSAPFAFFGHSLGALVAFEVARHQQRHGLAQPRHLIVSGARAPQRRSAAANLHLMNDADLIAQLETYNGTPPEVLANRELMELVLPAIRADFALGAGYRYLGAPLLTMPLTVLTGSTDTHVAPEDAAAWSAESSGPCQLTTFEGDHFFLDAQRTAVLARVRAALDAATPERLPLPA